MSLDSHEAGAVLEYRRRRRQVSLLAALAIYFAAGLGVTGAYHTGSIWSAWEGYLRLHVLDGFGCAGFFAVGWSRMDRDPWKGTGLLAVATAGIAAAGAFVAGAPGLDPLVMCFLGLGYGFFIWGYVIRYVAPFLPQQSSPENRVASRRIGTIVRPRPGGRAA